MTHRHKICAAVLLTSSMLFFTSAHAFQAEGLYTRLGVGFAAIVETPKATGEEALFPGFVVEGALGGYFAKYFAAEVMFSVSRGESNLRGGAGASPSNANVTRLDTRGLANLYFLHTVGSVQPFIFAGGGVCYFQHEGAPLAGAAGSMMPVAGDKVVGIWNIGAGVNYFIQERVALGLGYRFVAGGQPVKNSVHHVVVNLTYTF